MANEEQRTLLQLIAQSGDQGRAQWRAQQDQSRQLTADALARMLGGTTGRGPSATLLYNQSLQQAGAQAPWMAQRQQTLAARTPSYGKGSYGPTTKGAYSGYKTASDLKAAIQGRAAMLQADDQAAADAAMQRILQEFDTADQQRTAAMKEAAAQSDQAEADWVKYAQTVRPPSSSVRAYEGSPHEVSATPVEFGTPEYKDREFLRKYALQQEQGTASDWDKRGQAMLAAQQPNVAAIQALTQRPQGDYAREAAMRDFGVAPELAMGFFDPLTDVTDYSKARDLESWQQFGMPFSAYQAQQKAEQTAAEQAQQDQLDAAIYQSSGIGGQQLAGQVGLSMPELYDVLSSPEYAQAYDDIVNAAQVQDPVAAWEALQNAAANPQIARLLERTAAPYIPKGYDYYGNPLDTYSGG